MTDLTEVLARAIRGDTPTVVHATMPESSAVSSAKSRRWLLDDNGAQEVALDCIAALDAAGFQIVPKLPTDHMVATALPLAAEPAGGGYILRAHRALALLPIGAEFGGGEAYQNGLSAAAELIRDYCAMLAAAPKP